MRNTEQIIDHLKRVCGLAVRAAEMPVTGAESGVVCNAEKDVTVFTVVRGGYSAAFEIDGSGQAERVTAALAREVAYSVVSEKRTRTDDPFCAFLSGAGGVPHGVIAAKADYYVFAVYVAGYEKNVRDYLATMAGSDDLVVDMSDGVTAFCKKNDDENYYQSAGEFAAVLRENLTEEIKENVKIGVGGVAHGALELPKYYAYACSALKSGAEFDPVSGIYSYKEYALVKALSAMTSAEKESYVKIALDRNFKTVLSDVELMTAADAFVKHSLNISEAARSMYVHRNTLIYRLDKIEKLTGLNIRRFNDAMTFRLACMIYKML